jgi:hypothetical protein
MIEVVNEVKEDERKIRKEKEMVDKLLKLTLAYIAIIICLPAIYLPWHIRRTYLRTLVFLLYKFVQFRPIANFIITHKQKIYMGEINE